MERLTEEGQINTPMLDGGIFNVAETVLEMLSSEQREKVRLVDAPFVEGAFAAGVVASAGSDADECVEAAMEARTESKLHAE